MSEPKANSTVKLDFKEQFSRDQAKLKQAIKAFDIDDFTGETTVTRTKVVEGYEIKYQLLSSLERRLLHKRVTEAKGVVDPVEEGVAIVAEMLHKADGKTTSEKLNNMPGGLSPIRIF